MSLEARPIGEPWVESWGPRVEFKVDVVPDLGVSEKERKFMLLCIEGADIFSTCAKRQYFAIILAPNGRVVGTGYNGGPAGTRHCVDGGCPRMQEGSAPGSNYDNCIAIHAEENALLWSDPAMRQGGTIIINGSPCFGCAKKIANSGVARAVIIRDPSYAQSQWGIDLMESVGIQVVDVDPRDVGIES